MLCPRCGAYSPYNTAVCNRCGAKLVGDTSGKSRGRKFYRNAGKSEWEKNREQLLVRMNDTLDGILADKTKRAVLIAVVAAAALLLAAGLIGCASCVCGGCGGRMETPASGSDTVAASTSDTVTASGSDAQETSPSDAPELPGEAVTEEVVSDSAVEPEPTVPETEEAPPEDSKKPVPEDDDIVSVVEYIPSLYYDLKYATTDNFTGKVIYDFDEPRLRYGTVKKLAAAQEELVSMGYSLVIWDAYRPFYAQEALWEAFPDPNYVSDPATGYCSHSRGNTVDVTLTVIADASFPVMPSGFDEFSSKADRNYSDVSTTAAANSRLLERVMTAHGFTGYSGEWWHYSDTTEYPIIEVE